MKIFEVDKRTGLYVGARFDRDSTDRLETFLGQADVPNAVAADDFHVTIVYSRRPVPGYDPAETLAEPLTAVPTGYAVFGGEDDKPRCLVVLLDCPDLHDRHAEAEALGASYDYPDYRPHVTLSYDIGDLDEAALPDPSQLGDLSLSEIYAEPLDDEWTSDES